MSIIATSQHISDQLETKIINEVFVKKIEGNTFSKFVKPKETIIQPYRTSPDGKKVYLPFRWALENIPTISRPNRDILSTISPISKFNTTLRSVQQQIKDECIALLNKKDAYLSLSIPALVKRVSLSTSHQKLALKL